jgi:CTP synthase (UTP-ammonia lyase)
MAVMAEVIQIGIFGDYNPASPTLPALEKSIQHAAAALKISAEAQWLPTDSLLGPDLEK